MFGRKDIRPQPPDYFKWDPSQPANSMDDFRKFVELEAQKTIDWYWSAKKLKKLPSEGVQFFSLVLTAAAGLVPIVIQILRQVAPGIFPSITDSGPFASLLVGLAAGLLGLDKAFGYTSGWVRYTLTASTMTALLHDFRVDWIALSATSASPPTTDQQAALIKRAKDFVTAIQASLLQETKEWATEFQGNTGQLEMDVKSQLDALKAQMDKASQDKAAQDKAEQGTAKD